MSICDYMRLTCARDGISTGNRVSTEGRAVVMRARADLLESFGAKQVGVYEHRSNAELVACAQVLGKVIEENHLLLAAATRKSPSDPRRCSVRRTGAEKRTRAHFSRCMNACLEGNTAGFLNISQVRSLAWPRANLRFRCMHRMHGQRWRKRAGIGSGMIWAPALACAAAAATPRRPKARGGFHPRRHLDEARLEERQDAESRQQFGAALGVGIERGDRDATAAPTQRAQDFRRVGVHAHLAASCVPHLAAANLPRAQEHTAQRALSAQGCCAALRDPQPCTGQVFAHSCSPDGSALLPGCGGRGRTYPHVGRLCGRSAKRVPDGLVKIHDAELREAGRRLHHALHRCHRCATTWHFGPPGVRGD